MDDDRVLPFAPRSTTTDEFGEAKVTETAVSVKFRMPGEFKLEDLQHEVVRARARTERLRSKRLEPDAELKAIVTTLIEAFADVRDRLRFFDRTGELKVKYEAFRCALEGAGFDVRHENRFARAVAHRRLGELAEDRGDLDGAFLHYQLAVRARRDVGCRRRMERIRTYLEHRAARQERPRGNGE